MVSIAIQFRSQVSFLLLDMKIMCNLPGAFLTALVKVMEKMLIFGVHWQHFKLEVKIVECTCKFCSSLTLIKLEEIKPAYNNMTFF